MEEVVETVTTEEATPTATEEVTPVVEQTLADKVDALEEQIASLSEAIPAEIGDMLKDMNARIKALEEAPSAAVFGKEIEAMVVKHNEKLKLLIAMD